MTDSKYFTTTKKGEIFELKSELNSDKKEKKREAVKKVIASMTVGKDVSALFPDVANCMQVHLLLLLLFGNFCTTYIICCVLLLSFRLTQKSIMTFFRANCCMGTLLHAIF